MEEKSCDQAACGESKDKTQNKAKTEKDGEKFIQWFLLSRAFMSQSVTPALPIRLLTGLRIYGRFTEYDAYRSCNTASRSGMLLRLSSGSLTSTLPRHRFFRISSNIRLFSIIIRFRTIRISNGSFNG
jgi:hypothetical protein